MPPRPNILFFFPDQLRFDWTGSNPSVPVRTPNLGRLEREGVTFTNAICPSPLCAPCRAAIASGREYDRCRVPSNRVDYPLDQTTVYQLLRDSGYHVLGCGKFDLHKATRDWGLDGERLLEEWGFTDGIDNEGKWDGVGSGQNAPQGPYLQFLEERGLRQMHLDDFAKRRGHKDAAFPTTLPDDAYCDNWLAQNGLDLLRAVPAGEPWLIQINFTGPHDPWDITESMAELYRSSSFPAPNGNDQFGLERHNAVRRNYSAMVENIDRWVGVFLKELEARCELGNTLIAFSSDHGEMLGDHNGWGKGTPYQPSVGVPLVIWGPGVKEGLTCELPMTILDLTATFLEYAELPVPDDMDSRSLRALLAGETETHRDCVVSGLAQWRLAFDGRYKLIQGFEGGFEGEDVLYDLREDPLENHNAIGTAQAEAERLAEQLVRAQPTECP